jgi:hypothetical protein
LSSGGLADSGNSARSQISFGHASCSSRNFVSRRLNRHDGVESGIEIAAASAFPNEIWERGEEHDYLPPTEFLNAVEMHRME